VWMGNADNSPMAYISGVTGAGPIWHDFMEEAHRGRPVRVFTRPADLVRVDVCTPSGALPTALCRRHAAEWFVRGTEPHVLDTSYRAVAVDAGTDLAWADTCRGPRVARVFRILPADAVEWGRTAGIPAPPDETCLGQRVSADRSASPTAHVTRTPAHAASGTTSVDAGSGTRSVAAPPVAITRPAPNATFALSPQLPRASQRIDVMAQLGAGVRLDAVTLLVDDAPLATLRRPPYRTSWPLAPGAHTVRAIGVDAAGHHLDSPTVTFRVLAEEPRHVD